MFQTEVAAFKPSPRLPAKRVPVDLAWDADAVDLIRDALGSALGANEPAWARTLGLSYPELQHLVAVALPDAQDLHLPEPSLHAALLQGVPAVFHAHVASLLAHKRTNLPEQNARWLAHAICWACFGGGATLQRPQLLSQQKFSGVVLRYFSSLPL
jgi:hypothetical protein